MRSEPTRLLTSHEARQLVEDGWRHGRVCCRDATVIQCVCRFSITCPTHGLICVGSHD